MVADTAQVSQSGRFQEVIAQANKQGGHDDGQRAIALTRLLLARAKSLQSPQEKRQQAELDRMIALPHDKATLVQMTDQAFRTSTPERVADQLTHILDVQGVPRFFSPLDRTLLRGFQSFGSYLPGVAVPMVKEHMRRETANVILPAEPEMLRTHLRQRRSEGVRMNVNLLGEAILGEEESQRRLQSYLAALQVPEVECVSIKISTIYSQLSPLARRHSLHVVCDRLELLYRAAARGRFTRNDGREVSKFVYLDMEEYRDMQLTAEALMITLSRPGLQHVRAGVALQAYIPDSFMVMQQLAKWAQQRVASGGAPLTIRIVKGANMEMERVDASLHGWPQAPYQTKVDTDANFKRLVREGFQPSNRTALRLGVASHNLFDIALAMLWANDAGTLDDVQFEMLEGMANHQRRAIFELHSNVLLYAPACKREEFLNAIGYLIRRLDENTGEENFLRYAFKLEADSAEFQRLANGFLRSLSIIDSVAADPRRFQDRHTPATMPDVATHWSQYISEPDTDWSLVANSRWAESIVEQWMPRCNDQATTIPLVIAGRDIGESRCTQSSHDPSRPGTIACRYALATDDEVREAIACAKLDPSGWRSRWPEERLGILRQVAQQIRLRRAELMGAALADGGKTLYESDPEVSEAVDFVEFYALAAKECFERPLVQARGRGVVAVVSPWNFPIAIPCGGIAAALAAGNTVILKPASDTVLPAYILCQCFWDAGVPREALQLIPCRGSGPGKTLVSHPDVDVVILTGGTETAESMLRDAPAMDLLAETGGKNATICTALCDRDLAIKHILHSAFSHSGQKCSASSLLLLEEELYRDAEFRRSLEDAVRSLHVGSAWDLSTKIGPLVRPPTDALERGLKELEPGESWSVMPQQLDDNPSLWSPGLKWDTKPGSFTHMTELFGPVLGVIRFRRLDEAISIVNQTGFGLTSGLQSLDDREQQVWQKGIRAGNLYINRPTTGAIVLRQPFGGMGKSAFGPGIKAGGPNYVVPLMAFQEVVQSGQVAISHWMRPDLKLFYQSLASDESISALMQLAGDRGDAAWKRLQRGLTSFDQWIHQEFAATHDHQRLVGQDNFRRYLPVKHLRIRLTQGVRVDDVLLAIAAASGLGCRLAISFDDSVDVSIVEFCDRISEPFGGLVEWIEERDQECSQAIARSEVQRLRYLGTDRVPEAIREAALKAHVPIVQRPMLCDGRIELLWYVEEQSLSHDYHRYGNLNLRAQEPRAAVL
jgi:RHH-type transcriptional regulator, proline utilization regulon repressor / proline dehydrogenase / delta 1-pyrroline-5-carboxylate dehydrogenase